MSRVESKQRPEPFELPEYVDNEGNPFDPKESDLIQKLEQAAQDALDDKDSLQSEIDNKPVFILCQHLRGVVPAKTDPEDLKWVVQRWYNLAKMRLPPNCLEEDFDTVWLQFLDIWEHKKVKFPKKDALNLAIKQATQREYILPELECLVDERLKKLGYVCFELQQLSGENPFFLSQEDAGNIVGVCQKKGRLLLSRLVQLKIIERVKIGHTGRASEYRYVAPTILQKQSLVKGKGGANKIHKIIMTYTISNEFQDCQDIQDSHDVQDLHDLND